MINLIIKAMGGYTRREYIKASLESQSEKILINNFRELLKKGYVKVEGYEFKRMARRDKKGKFTK